MADYDLTHTIGQYLDRHLVIPLLDFLQIKELYPEEEILAGKLDILEQTNMVDFATDIQAQLGGTVAADQAEAAAAKKAGILSKLKKLKEESEASIKLFQNEDVLSHIESTRDGAALYEYLRKEYDFKPEMLETMYEYAKFQFDCGNYGGAAEFLYHYRILSTDPVKSFSALWGKFAAEILVSNWDAAFEDLNHLKEYMDGKNPGSALQQLQQRTWLIHWSLFVFFNHPKGRDGIIDLFLYQPQYCNAIQTVCPHILRYLTTAVITNKRRRNVLKDLVKVIQQESYTYRDPITEFLECLYVNFDFDGAQQKLRECETVLANDFFLVACRDDFIENARLFIFETYCRIHNTISISMLADKLNMPTDKAEEWIVNLIRNARLDAKIDSKDGHVVMATQVPNIYHQVIEKTKTITLRSTMLAENIEKRRTGGDRGDREGGGGRGGGGGGYRGRGGPRGGRGGGGRGGGRGGHGGGDRGDRGGDDGGGEERSDGRTSYRGGHGGAPQRSDRGGYRERVSFGGDRRRERT